jgi:hypothetical protein
MRWRAGLLSGCLIAGVACCAILGGISAGARAASQDPAATSTTLSLALPAVVYASPQVETYTVTVTSPAGTPTGTAAITWPNGNVACTVALSGGTGSCTTSSQSGYPQTVTVKAAYSGDQLFAPSVSAAQAYTVAKDPTTTVWTLSPTTITYGHEQVAQAFAAMTPTYRTNNGGSLAGLNVSLPRGGLHCTGNCGSFTFFATAYPAGTVKAVVASYPGNEIFAASSSQAITLRVIKASSTTTLTLSAAKITYGHELAERLSVKVSPRWAGTPGGVVAIKHGTTVLCKVTLSNGKGSCTLSARALAVGADHVFATYAGNGNFTGSSSAPKALTIVR